MVTQLLKGKQLMYHQAQIQMLASNSKSVFSIQFFQVYSWILVNLFKMFASPLASSAPLPSSAIEQARCVMAVFTGDEVCDVEPQEGN